jgi:uncharacterized protein YfaS (alpha-2-macroglobulin family)
MRTLVTVALLVFAICYGSTPAQQPDYTSIRAEAEKLFAEGSYSKAHDLYARARARGLAPGESRWVAFRLADTLWRAQAGSKTPDSTRYDEAQRALEDLVRDDKREQDQDRVWAEVHESLGDFWWARNESRNLSIAWPNYQRALDWWAGSSDIDAARDRYLKIVWKVASPPAGQGSYYYGYYGNTVPLDVLENALKIAQSDNDKAHLHYLVAMSIQSGGDYNQRSRVPEEFEAAIAPGKSTEWCDDALYRYAEWLMNSGRTVRDPNGQWRQQPDYVKALELFRRLVDQYQKGETRYYDQAMQQIATITSPVVGVSVPSAFLPGSEIQFGLTWRNAKTIDLALYKIDLTRDVRFQDTNGQVASWLQYTQLRGREKVKSLVRQTADNGDHTPGQEMVRLESALPVGAYLLEARSGSVSARDLVLVTDATVVLKTAGKQALVYFCNAIDGSPIPNADVRIWQRYNTTWYAEQAGRTNQDGLANFTLQHNGSNAEIFASAASQDRQAFADGYSYGYYANQQPWRIYAFTDRPAYRPGETAQWKLVARRYDGSVYSTPAGQSIQFEITDPRGARVKEGTSNLNAFGSAWDSLALTETMPLGEYRVTFWDVGRHNQIGVATLFRLEEYKLPEFKIAVTTPEEGGRKKAFRVGERVEVNVQADYYFGGAVTNANVEVLVYQNPFYHRWFAPHDYAWYYEDLEPGRAYGGSQGQIIKHETIKTDAAGKAHLVFDTPRDQGQDFEYRIEARVADSSRRQIIGENTVRVSRQRYYVYPQARHYIYRPQDKVGVDIKALDANDQPVQQEGKVRLTRDYWYEIWLDPSGREVKGDELKRLQEPGKIFPPASADPAKPWRLKFRGYQHDEILSRDVKTDAEGKAEFTFTAEREGYYRISWASDDGTTPIQADTAVWVTTGATTDLGYRHGGVEIIADTDTFRAGMTAPVMLAAPVSDRYVLFSVEGEDLYSCQLVHLTGTVKLIELPIEEKHVPNIFLTAAMVSERQIFMDTKQVVVPPVEQFLSVEVKADRSQYQPREEATLTVSTRDHDGNPVAAEVALGMVDESVYYIQQDYAGDPRRFYYGSKRQQRVQTVSTFQQKNYAKLVEGTNNQLVDDRSLIGRDSDRLQLYKELAKDSNGVSERARSGQIGGMSESATVTADSMSLLNLQAEQRALPLNGRMAAIDGIDREDKKTGGLGGGRESAVQVRNDFRSTILWRPDVVTDQTGKATLKVKFPDSLTNWTATARAASAASQFGTATASARTKQPLIVRLQAPRFFVAGDSVTISAVINNNTDKPMRVATSLEAEGLSLKAADQVRNARVPIEVPASGEARVDWPVTVAAPGFPKLKVIARGDRYADAMERSFVAYEHGIEKFITKSGKLRGDAVAVSLDLPSARKPGSTALTVQVAPSMAVALLDALPYLIDYPYGCTEQTMSRFLPAAITAKTLKDLGLRPEDVMGKLFGGISQQAPSKPRAAPLDLHKLDSMIKLSLARLYDFQHGDGGWGWWKEDDSDHFMTAYVVWGLSLARQAGIDVNSGALDRAVDYLDKELVNEELNYDRQAWMLHALSVYHEESGQKETPRFQAKALDNLWTNRDRLNAYTRALLALAGHYYGDEEKARTLIQNLENGVKIDSSPDVSMVITGPQSTNAATMATAHWGEDGVYWRWSDGGVEATSFALRALLAIDPGNKLVEPVTNWLVKNRRGAQWSNTRDTAIAVLCLNDYLRQSGELQAGGAYTLAVNGRTIAEKDLTAQDALSAPSQFPVPAEYLKDGANDIRITRKGGSNALYFSATARFFSQEEPVTPAGNEIFARRDYYKLVGRETLLKGYVYDRRPLRDGETVTSGDRVEVVVTIEAKNNYEYLLFEDLKPAGLEAVQIRSDDPLFARELKSSGAIHKLGGATPSTNGASGKAPVLQEPALQRSFEEDGVDYTDRTACVHQELRDRKVALFIDKLPEGIWEIHYDLRAEVPGQFHALPVVGQAMYVPEIRCNGSEVRIKVEDKGQAR